MNGRVRGVASGMLLACLLAVQSAFGECGPCPVTEVANCDGFGFVVTCEGGVYSETSRCRYIYGPFDDPIAIYCQGTRTYSSGNVYAFDIGWSAETCQLLNLSVECAPTPIPMSPSPIDTPTPIPTPWTPTSTPYIPTLPPTDTPRSTPTPTRRPVVLGPCYGDCNADRKVVVNELIRCVRIALGRVTVDECPSIDDDLNRIADVAELVKAVNAALVGCFD